jgi:hypothetical protein
MLFRKFRFIQTKYCLKIFIIKVIIDILLSKWLKRILETVKIKKESYSKWVKTKYHVLKEEWYLENEIHWNKELFPYFKFLNKHAHHIFVENDGENFQK